MKKANDIEMFDVDAQLDAVFGKEGSPERAMAEERANAFFTGQIIEDARKRANITQEELAQREAVRSPRYQLSIVSLLRWVSL